MLIVYTPIESSGNEIGFKQRENRVQSLTENNKDVQCKHRCAILANLGEEEQYHRSDGCFFVSDSQRNQLTVFGVQLNIWTTFRLKF